MSENLDSASQLVSRDLAVIVRVHDPEQHVRRGDDGLVEFGLADGAITVGVNTIKGRLDRGPADLSNAIIDLARLKLTVRVLVGGHKKTLNSSLDALAKLSGLDVTITIRIHHIHEVLPRLVHHILSSFLSCHLLLSLKYETEHWSLVEHVLPRRVGLLPRDDAVTVGVRAEEETTGQQVSCVNSLFLGDQVVIVGVGQLEQQLASIL